MGRPAGSKNKPKSDAVTTDGYANAFSGTGTRRDRSTYTAKNVPLLIDQLTAMSLYVGDGMARRIIDVPAEEMTRAGIDLEGMPEVTEKKVMARFDELDVMKRVNDALIWSGVFGGSIIVLGLNDGGTLELPVNDDGVKDIEFLRPYDRYQATIQSRVSDPMNPQYGEPAMWLISPHTGGTPYQVHNSRVIMFDGDAVPDQMRQQNLGWGASKFQACINELTRLGTSHQWANSLLERAQQAVHKIPDLSGKLRAPGGEALIQARVDVVDMIRGILNTIVIDEAEGYEIISNSFAGIPDILDRFAEMLSAVTGIPVYLLMGRSPGGLNATGDANKEAWNARIESQQRDVLMKPLDRIVGYIVRGINGSDGGDYKLCFNPLSVPSGKEKAEIEKTEAETDKTEMETMTGYINAGVIDPGEARTQVAEEYGIDPLDVPEPVQPDDAAILAGAQPGKKVTP